MNPSQYPRTAAAAAENAHFERLASRIALLGFACPLIFVTFFFVTPYGGKDVSFFVGADLGAKLIAFGMFMFLAFMFSGALFFVLDPNEATSFGRRGRSDSAYLNGTMVGILGRSKGTSRQHAKVAAALLALSARVEAFNITGFDNVAQILTAQSTTLRKEVEALWPELEGIDGQVDATFGTQFLDRTGRLIVSYSDKLDRLSTLRAAHRSALLFDTPAGQQAALALVAQQMQ